MITYELYIYSVESKKQTTALTDMQPRDFDVLLKTMLAMDEDQIEQTHVTLEREGSMEYHFIIVFDGANAMTFVKSDDPDVKAVIIQKCDRRL